MSVASPAPTSHPLPRQPSAQQRQFPRLTRAHFAPSPSAVKAARVYRQVPPPRLHSLRRTPSFRQIPCQVELRKVDGVFQLVVAHKEEDDDETGGRVWHIHPHPGTTLPPSPKYDVYEGIFKILAEPEKLETPVPPSHQLWIYGF